MNSLAKRQAFHLCCLVLASDWALHAQESTPQGRWEGVIQTPGQALGIMVGLAQPLEGDWVGKISIPIQGMSDFTLSNLKVDGAEVSFTMKDLPGIPRFRGKLSENGRRLYGIFSHGGGRVPFKLQRKGDVDPAKVAAQKPPPPPIEGIPGEGLAGIWLGRLEIGQVGLRLLFRITPNPEGSLTGTLNKVP